MKMTSAISFTHGHLLRYNVDNKYHSLWKKNHGALFTLWKNLRGGTFDIFQLSQKYKQIQFSNITSLRGIISRTINQGNNSSLFQTKKNIVPISFTSIHSENWTGKLLIHKDSWNIFLENFKHHVYFLYQSMLNNLILFL